MRKVNIWAWESGSMIISGMIPLPAFTKMHLLDGATGNGALGPAITLCLLYVKGLPWSIAGCLIFTLMKG